MRAARSLAAFAVLALAALPLLAADPAPAPRVRGGPPPKRVWQKNCAGKPAPAVGDVVLEVVERPSRDEAWVRADWTQGPLAQAGPVWLSLLLPDGAFLVVGALETRLPDGRARGTDAWLVRFPTDRTLDLAVRLRVDTEDGPALREFPVRLWEVPPEQP
jgi:hypothetical protein